MESAWALHRAWPKPTSSSPRQRPQRLRPPNSRASSRQRTDSPDPRLSPTATRRDCRSSWQGIAERTSTGRLLTPAARRHVARMLHAIAPAAGRLDRRFATLLRQRAIMPCKSEPSWPSPPRRFTPPLARPIPGAGGLQRPPPGQAERSAGRGERSPAGVRGLLDPVLAGHCEPAREQLHLATVLVLNDAFYQVREAESQAFFALTTPKPRLPVSTICSAVSSASSPRHSRRAPAASSCSTGRRLANLRAALH